MLVADLTREVKKEDSATSSDHILCNRRKILGKLDYIFGSGDGTVAAVDLPEDPQ
jgi:hypothetical protein